MKVVVAGGSGAPGRRLCDDLAKGGHDVVVLSRTGEPGRHRRVRWDVASDGPWRRELGGSAVLNLAGALVDRRPTRRNIALPASSRVEPTLALAAAARTLGTVLVLIQASTAGAGSRPCGHADGARCCGCAGPDVEGAVSPAGPLPASGPT